MIKYQIISISSFISDIYPFFLCAIIALGWALSLYIIIVKKKSEYKTRIDFRRAIILMLAKMVYADKKRKDCEIERVKETIRRYYKTEKEREEALNLFYKHAKDIENHFNLVNLNWSEITILKESNVEKSELVMELLAVAYADDEFHSNEKFVMGYIRNYLDISLQEYNSIKAIFMKKREKGFYNLDESYKKQDSNNQKSNNKESYNGNRSDYSGGYYSKNSYSGDSHSNQSTGSENTNNSYKATETPDRNKEAYTILGVDANVSDEEVKKAYRAMAIKFHPDNAAKLGDEAIRQATETMKQINEAWETVKMARGIK